MKCLTRLSKLWQLRAVVKILPKNIGQRAIWGIRQYVRCLCEKFDKQKYKYARIYRLYGIVSEK